MSAPEEEKPAPFESYTGEAKFSPIPLSLGSAQIKPEDRRLIQARAYESMQYYSNEQISRLKKQAELILQQARELEERVKLSQEIYLSEMRFQPRINGIYYLYQKEETRVLSMIGPQEWGRKFPYKRYIATVRLLADQTWDILELNPEEEPFTDQKTGN